MGGTMHIGSRRTYIKGVPLVNMQDYKFSFICFQSFSCIRKEKSTVGDVLNEIKTKVELSHPNAELRLLEVFYHKIYKIFPIHEKIENINDEYWTLRAEEIPEEEKNLEPNDRLIHVYHFTKEIAQNQVWKFAFLSLGRPEYPEDSDIVSSRFQRRDVYGAWEQYLGLEHSDTTTPKRAYTVNQNRHTFEKPVKIYN